MCSALAGCPKPFLVGDGIQVCVSEPPSREAVAVEAAPISLDSQVPEIERNPFIDQEASYA